MDFRSIKLDDRLQRAVTAAGFTAMTPVQEAALPLGLEGRDLICTAQTGTGKTAAFALPILQHLLDTPRKRGRVRALIVTPTRELAEQVHAAIQELGRYTNLRSATVYGGVGMAQQTQALRKGADIIVACPGRLLDHINRGAADLGSVEMLVLDEADRMLDMGFLPDVRRVIAKTPSARQTMLFSATFAPELRRLACEIQRDPTRVEMGIAAPATTIAHTICPVSHTRKTELLLTLLEGTGTGSVLIFTRTKHRADKLAAQMERAGYRVDALHSNKNQNQRQRTLDGFRSGKVQMLVATDIASRGLDIERVSLVINYDIPDNADAYIHRIGRTGRAERTGDALTFVTSDDRGTVWEIEQVLGEGITVREVEGFDYGPPSFLSGGSGGGRRAPSTPSSWSSRGGGLSRGGGRPVNRGSRRTSSRSRR